MPLSTEQRATSPLLIEHSGKRMAISPVDPQLASYLEAALSYERVTLLYGRARAEALRRDREPVKVERINCYAYDELGRLECLNGYEKRVLRLLRSLNRPWQTVQLRPHPRPEVYRPRWNRLDLPSLRYRQREVLERISRNRCGVIHAPPGYGKSFLLRLLAQLYPQARIDIVVKPLDVLIPLYEELLANMPDVGLICGHTHEFGRRIQCVSLGSLHQMAGDADFLLGDEIHQMATDKLLGVLGRYLESRNFGFTASPNCRGDGADRELEGIFGPVIFHLTPQEAREHAVVVPVEVRWLPVHLPANPCLVLGRKLEGIEKERAGIWRNEPRNRLIAEAARSYGPEVQTLITVNTVDHAIRLKQRLPEFTLVYNEGSLPPTRRKRLIRHRLLSEQEPEMTRVRRRELQQQFEAGELKKVIATTVWNTGVDFQRLAVLIRADAGASAIRNIQIPGRVTRVHAESGKEVGIVHDFLDCFDRGFRRRSDQRKRHYAAQGFQQVNLPVPGKCRERLPLSTEKG